MVPKSMSSEVENIEIKRKNNTDKLNLSGQKSRTNSICPCFYFNLITLTFLRSYTTLMQLSTVTRQEVK